MTSGRRSSSLFRISTLRRWGRINAFVGAKKEEHTSISSPGFERQPQREVGPACLACSDITIGTMEEGYQTYCWCASSTFNSALKYCAYVSIFNAPGLRASISRGASLSKGFSGVTLSIAAWTNGGSSYSGSFLDFRGRSEGQRGITLCGGTCRPVPDRRIYVSWSRYSKRL